MKETYLIIYILFKKSLKIPKG